jgi:REP element-mobilizing transposase RayT
VRRAFLCGEDQLTGKSYEHRRGWIEDRIRVLSSLFTVELCAYAVMSNHYHLVVRLNPSESDAWSNDEVLTRWTALFRGPLLVQRYRADETLSAAELKTVQSIAAVFRDRLGSLSWFMKCLNEPIARMANTEDGCTGHFWEARFHSQALRSERALLTAMAYVDLNPIRAKIAQTPETSDYTSIKVRAERHNQKTALGKAVSGMLERGDLNHFESPVRPLLPFSDVVNHQQGAGQRTECLPMPEVDYFKLVDASGRMVVRGKRGRIDPEMASILDRLGLSADQWSDASTAFRQHYRGGDLRFLKTA